MRYELTTSSGQYLLFLPAPSVVVAVVRRRGDEEIARAMVEQTKILFRTEPSLAVFVDISEMKNYATEARVLLTSFIKDVQPRIRMLHCYVRSKIVAMGVAVANVALESRIEAHSARARFDAAIQLETARVLGLKRPSIKPQLK